ncbi:helix-turn-helix transcriptional regulator [Azotosporobacter soli]|uniref:helix-turn-helix domain-containing protein n=1 Tax=Azotosporobacter soli TaxID=3055040 RepID=UPI0031FEFDA4
MINIRVSELMGKKKLTQKALSDLTGIRPNTISALWYGTAKRLEIEHINQLCAALDCSPSDLLEYIPDQNKNEVDEF